MKPIDCKMRTHFTIQVSKNIRNATKRIKKILEANEGKGNLKKTFDNLKYLSNNEKMLILKLLHEEMFDGTLGNFTGLKKKIELFERAKLYHVRPFPISKSHEETLKTEAI